MIKNFLVKLLYPLTPIMRQIKNKLFDNGKVYISTDDGYITKYRLFGKTVADKYNTEKNTSNNIDSNPVFYFKVNRVADYTLLNIQLWINIVSKYDADFYFVCDNNQLERKILTNCHFKDGNIKFIRSDRKSLNDKAKNLCSEGLENMTCAHLTPFYHAKEKGYSRFWNIDADDTTFLLYPKRVIEILKNAENIALRDGINAFSLDMWRSKTNGKHWSLGILLIDGGNFCEVFDNIKDNNWSKETLEFDTFFNLDWFFTYLKNHHIRKIDSFYIENCMFFHWANMILDPVGSWICYWHNGKIKYPILSDIFKRTDIGIRDIADCIKIDIGITEDECVNFWENELSTLRLLSMKKKKLFGIAGLDEDEYCDKE